MKCWIFHKWSDWFDPKPAITTHNGNTVGVLMVQERKCLQCNRRKIRAAYE